MKILVLINHHVGLYKFHKELLEELLRQHEVHICLPYGSFVDELCNMGCQFTDCKYLDRHGTNLVGEFMLFRFYKKLVLRLKPDIVFTYTIKPNVYGGMVCSILGIPYVADITGLGVAIQNGGWMRRLTLWLYQVGLRKAQMVFFENKENLRLFLDRRMVRGRYGLLPGSGVNLEQYSLMEYPKERQQTVFLTVGRLMRDKGTDDILQAAERIHQKYKGVVFRLIGDCEEKEYKEKLACAVSNGTIEYIGFQADIRPFLKSSHAVLHASYHEGMSNVLLEAAASGRPVIATDIPGCRETFIEGKSGIAFRAREVDSLVDAVERFLRMTWEEKKVMGQMSRKKAEMEFDRNIIMEAYLNEIQQMSS